MAWYYVKINEDNTMVIYAYGLETKEATGQLKYDKKMNEYSILKIANNDDQKGAEWALSYLPDVIKKGFPEKDIVMIG
jgi:hypothetical protein